MNKSLFTTLGVEDLERLIECSVEKALLKQSFNFHAPNQGEEILTVEQAAKFLNLTVPTMYSKVSRGDLPKIKQSGRLYFLKEELIEHLKSGRQVTEQEGIDNAVLPSNSKSTQS